VEVDPVRALAAAMEGYRVLPAAEAAPLGDVFITVTGNLHVLRPEHFAVMKDGAVLANAGHFDVEIDLPGLTAAARRRRRVRRVLDEFDLGDGRRLYVAAEGRLVNLAAAEGHPADVMDMSFADQALAAEWLVANQGKLEPRVYRLPEYLDAEVARLKLESLGGGLESLTPEQERYLRSWEAGT
jgi:adenosylhomocysteinase